MQFNFFTNY